MSSGGFGTSFHSLVVPMRASGVSLRLTRPAKLSEVRAMFLLTGTWCQSGSQDVLCCGVCLYGAAEDMRTVGMTGTPSECALHTGSTFAGP
jgi:hypothetical protein